MPCRGTFTKEGLEVGWSPREACTGTRRKGRLCLQLLVEMCAAGQGGREVMAMR